MSQPIRLIRKPVRFDTFLARKNFCSEKLLVRKKKIGWKTFQSENFFVGKKNLVGKILGPKKILVGKFE